jgi:hypothetical protein
LPVVDRIHLCSSKSPEECLPPHGIPPDGQVALPLLCPDFEHALQNPVSIDFHVKMPMDILSYNCKLEKWLVENGYSARPTDVLGDGSCFFRAISLLLFGTQKYHNDLRLLAAQYMYFSSEHEFDDNPELNNTYRMRTFATQLSILALCKVLKVSLIIVSQELSSYPASEQTGLPLPDGYGKYITTQVEKFTYPGSSRTLCVQYLPSEVHYRACTLARPSAPLNPVDIIIPAREQLYHKSHAKREMLPHYLVKKPDDGTVYENEYFVENVGDNLVYKKLSYPAEHKFLQL